MKYIPQGSTVPFTVRYANPEGRKKPTQTPGGNVALNPLLLATLMNQPYGGLANPSLQGLSGNMMTMNGMQGLSGMGGQDGCNIYVSNLPLDWDDNALRILFSPFGTIVSCRVNRHRATGLSRGFGFVSFPSAECAQAAIANMHGFVVGNNRLNVEVKKEVNNSRPY